LSQLESELDKAIKTERYEDAARFRDEITQVRQAAGRKIDV
jgi:protein arginine kinase activator